MKKLFWILLSIIMLIISIDFKKVFGEELKYFEYHNPNYLVFGNNNDNVKAQFSFKYCVLKNYPVLYLAHTQLMYYRLYHNQGFEDINFLPEIFFQFKTKNNIFDNYEFNFIDFIRLCPYQHNSNGQDVTESRSFDLYYGMIQMSCRYDEFTRFGLSGKIFNYYWVAKENPDIKKYKGFYETEIFLETKNRSIFRYEKIYIKGSSILSDYRTFEIGYKFKLKSLNTRPLFFIQFFSGYVEYQLNYNKKNNALRIGLSLENI